MSSHRAAAIRVALALIFASMTSPMSAQNALSRDEQAIVTFIDRHNEDALKLLERAVNINSGTQNFAGVREVGKVFAAELDALGFKSRWVDRKSVV